VLEIEESFAFP